MATIEQAVLDRLLAAAPVAAVVGTRGYLLILPQAAKANEPRFPALRVQRISRIRRVTLRGDLTNLFWARIQVDIWTNTRDNGDGYATASDGDTAIRNALMLTSAGGQHFFSAGSPPEIEVTSVGLLDDAVEYVPEELRQIRMRQDFGVMFREVQA